MTARNDYDAIVIGAGANGLVAAAALGRAGRRVLVVESVEEIGGQSRTRELAPGFRSAPLATDAGWLPPSVSQGLGLRLPMVAPELSVTVATPDGECLALACDVAAAAAAIEMHSPRDAKRWGAFAGLARKLSGFLEALYQLPAPSIDTTSLKDLAPLVGLGRQYRALGRTDMAQLLRVLPMPIEDLLDDAFDTDLLKAAIGAGGVRDIRQGPRSGGTAFVFLHYLAGAPAGSVRARSWWRDGPGAFTDAVAELVRRHDGAIRTGVGDTKILVSDDAVTGIALATGEEIRAPVVVSSADPARTLLGMIDPVWLDPELLRAVQNIKFRGCTSVVEYALDRLPVLRGVGARENALASVVTLTADLVSLERAFDAAKYGMVVDEPHIEITVPSLRWPSLAPVGKHVLVARVQYTPYQLRNGQRWSEDQADRLGDAVTMAIARVVPGFTDSVLHRRVLTPHDLEQRFGLTEGAATHGEITLDQILYMRPFAGWGQSAMPIRGLYLGGAGAHPGPGVLGGAGWFAARRVLGDSKRA